MNWLNRGALAALQFRPMKEADYVGYAGAGPDSMMLDDIGNATVIADLSYDEEHQGISFMTYDEDQESDIWFNVSIEAANSIGKDRFTSFLRLIGGTKPGTLMDRLEKLGYSQDTLDEHQVEELIKALSVRQNKTHVVNDESILTRLRAQLSE